MPVQAAPTLIDRTYRVEAKLGAGGGGAVYRATHRATGRVVAVKLLRQRAAANQPDGRLTPSPTLAREFQTLASIHHPNVIGVVDYGFDQQWGPYFAMELLQGAEPLLAAARSEPLAVKIELLAQLLRALAYLHRRRVLHRDLKPSNVLCSGGAVKVVDFGIALTRGLSDPGIAGTIAYMAPELWRGSPPTVQSDLFAVGVMTFQLLTGAALEPDFPSSFDYTTSTHTSAPDVYVDAEFAARLGIRKFDPEALDSATLSVPDAIRSVLRRLLAADPAERYSSAEDVLRDLSGATGYVLPIETALTRDYFLQVPGLVGRDAELVRLRRALDAADTRRGSVWLIGGESGVGKSRLFSELRTLALIRGASVMTGQAVAEGGRSFHVWLQVLRTLCLRAEVPDAEASVLKPLVPELTALLARPVPDAPALAPDSARQRLVDALTTVLRMQDRTTLILLDDLHWADVDSLKLLVALCATAPTLPVVIIGSYRSDEAPTLPDRVPAASVLKLNRLSQNECAALAASVSAAVSDDPQLIHYLFRQSEGNAFFLIEVLRELARQAGQLDRVAQAPHPEHLLTDRITQVTRRCLEHVPRDDHPLLELAATAGRELDLSVLGVLAPDVDLTQWLSRCANAAVLERDAERWQFRHDKIRDAALAQMSAEARRHAHAQVARATEAAYPGEARSAKVAVLAHHFASAGDGMRAAEYHVMAGDLATRLCAYGESRQQYDHALRALATLPVNDATRRLQIDTLLKIVYTRFVSDPPEENFARMAQARALLNEIGSSADRAPEDMLREARIEHATGRVHFYRGDIPQAIAHYRNVLPVAKASGDEELLALPSCLIGTALLTQGRVRDAEPLLSQAIEPLERLGEPFEWFRATGYLGACLVASGELEAGIARLDAVLARAKRIRQPSMLAAAYLMRGTSFLLSGDWPLVIENLSEVIELATETGDKLHLSLAWSGVGWARSHLGSVERGRMCRQRGVEFAHSLGGQLMLADWYRAGDAEMALHAGEFDRALALADDVVRDGTAAGLLLSLGIGERVRGEVFAQYGQTADCDDRMRASINVLEDAGLLPQAAWSRMRWAVRLRQRRDERAAEELFGEAEAHFARSGCVYALTELNRLQELPTL